MQTPETTKSGMPLDPATGDPVGMVGMSAAIERRLVPMLQAHFPKSAGQITALLVTFDDEEISARDRVRGLLFAAAGNLAIRHNRINIDDMGKVLDAGESWLETAEGRTIERYKKLLTKFLVAGVINRGEVRRATL